MLNKRYLQALILGISLIISGLLLIVSRAEVIIAIITGLIGFVVILENLPLFFEGLLTYNHDYKQKIKLISATISILIAAILIFFHNQIFVIVVALLLIILPIIRILLVKDKKNMTSEIVRIVLGVILFIFGPWNFVDLVFDIFGYIFLALGVALIVYAFIQRRSSKKDDNDVSNNSNTNNKTRDVIDAEVREL